MNTDPPAPPPDPELETTPLPPLAEISPSNLNVEALIITAPPPEPPAVADKTDAPIICQYIKSHC